MGSTRFSTRLRYATAWQAKFATKGWRMGFETVSARWPSALQASAKSLKKCWTVLSGLLACRVQFQMRSPPIV